MATACTNKELWNTLWQSLSSRNDDSSMDNAYQGVACTCAALVTLTFLVSTWSQNYSQVDKLWSIAPVMYAWMTVVDTRTLVMATVATVWGTRLTWNFHRRGGYQFPALRRGDEDYRWAEIRQGKFIAWLKYPIPWMIFNLTFISFYQNVLLMLTASPSLVAYTVARRGGCGKSNTLEPLDFIAAVLVLSFVLLEGIADNQQYAFQTEKYRRKATGETLTGEFVDGFCQSGLFAIVRKPNYAAEQAVWISYYLFSVAATKQWWNWSALGWILLCALFQSSAWFTELLTRRKYPKYAQYQKQLPLFVPRSVLVIATQRYKEDLAKT